MDRSLGFEPGMKPVQAISIYPEPRLYAARARFGDTLQIPLAPYETLVLAFATHQPIQGLKPATELVRRRIAIASMQTDVSRLRLNGGTNGPGREPAGPLPDRASSLQVQLDADVTISAPAAELLVVAEAGKPLPAPASATLLVDGRAVELKPNSSATGWSATGQPVREHWLFLRGSVPGGAHRLSLKLLEDDSPMQISAWLWATKAGGEKSSHASALPPPEIISLDAQPLFGPTNLQSAARSH